MSADGSTPASVKDDASFMEVSVNTGCKHARYYVRQIAKEALEDVMENGGTLVVSRSGREIQLVQRRKPIEP